MITMFFRKAKHYKYLLKKDFEIECPELPLFEISFNNYVSLNNGILKISKGYAWDGSSIPLKKWFKWIYDCDKHCKIASLIHDALCQLIREQSLSMKYKSQVDAIYRKWCILGGMNKRIANFRYKGLRRFGNPFVQPKPDSDKGKVYKETIDY